jgi:hypothetical protein
MRGLIKKILREGAGKKLSQDEFIARANIKHDNKYDYSKVIYKNTTTPVTIVCPIHGEFQQIPKSHLIGYECFDCGVKKRTEAKRFNDLEFIERANKIHNNKYDYSLVNYIDNRTKVKIICPTHGVFTQVPASHLQGMGCKGCSNEESQKRQTKGTEKFIEQSKLVHGDKYDYSLVDYKNAYTHVTIICPIHGPFQQSPTSHIKGIQCTQCGKESSQKSRTWTKDDFVNKAREVHGNKYDYTPSVYINYTTPVEIICPVHGRFTQRPDSHINSIGCQECANELRSKNQRSTTDEFINMANTVHGFKYNYSKSEYKNNHTKLIITCKKHGDFVQTPANHISGRQGCPTCNESQGEKLIQSILEKNNLQYERQKKFVDCFNISISKKGNKRCFKLPFDFYLPTFNTCIEFDGIQHFQPVDKFGGEETFNKQKMLDKIKTQYCKINGVNLIRVPYSLKKGDVESFIKKELGITS